VAIGRVVFTSREHVMALEPRGKGMLGITLRYPYEVRDEKDYFDDIPAEKVTKDMLELAAHIVKTKQGHFKPDKFDDRYEGALKDLLRKKAAGKPIERVEPEEPSNVVSLMDALRQSVKGKKAAATGRRKTARGTHHRAAKKARSAARHRKAS
jgi:DNA end-binding protein Ku